MNGEHLQFLVSRRGFEAHRIAHLRIHQGLREGRTCADSSLARFRLIGPNYLVGFLLPILIPDVNRAPKADLLRIGGRFGDDDRIQRLLYPLNGCFNSTYVSERIATCCAGSVQKSTFLFQQRICLLS